VNMQFVPQGITARPAKDRKIRSSLVRRLVHAQDDPAKHRIRAWLCDLNDDELSKLGCTSDDIAALRGTQTSSLSRRKQWPSNQLRTARDRSGHSGCIRPVYRERYEAEAGQ